MPFELTTPVTPGPLSIEQAETINAALEELVRLSNLQPSAPITISESLSGYVIGADIDLAFKAKITGSGTDSNGNTVYSWKSQKPDKKGKWLDLENGPSGTTTVNPAYEMNLSALVATGTIVDMYRGFLNINSTDLEYGFMGTSGSGFLQVFSVMTNNVTLSGLTAIFDGVAAPITPTAVLCTGQTDQKQNGPWITQNGAWTRPAQYATGQTINSGFVCSVAYGLTFNQGLWFLTPNPNAGSIVVDTTATQWSKWSASGTNAGAVDLTDKQLMGTKRKVFEAIKVGAMASNQAQFWTTPGFAFLVEGTGTGVAYGGGPAVAGAWTSDSAGSSPAPTTIDSGFAFAGMQYPLYLVTDPKEKCVGAMDGVVAGSRALLILSNRGFINWMSKGGDGPGTPASGDLAGASMGGVDGSVFYLKVYRSDFSYTFTFDKNGNFTVNNINGRINGGTH